MQTVMGSPLSAASLKGWEPLH